MDINEMAEQIYRGKWRKLEEGKSTGIGEGLSVNEWETLNEKEKKEEIIRSETIKEKSKRKASSWKECKPQKYTKPPSKKIYPENPVSRVQTKPSYQELERNQEVDII